MERLLVSCITRTYHPDPHRKILSIGGIYRGKLWEHSEIDAINNIENHEITYYINKGNYSLELVVASYQYIKYLKTQSDALEPDNLLALPEMPLTTKTL